MPSDVNTAFCPYKGLQPYTEEDRSYFFGREQEREIIASNLYASPLTVFYGASGVGKTSVLRAGVVPQLRQTPKVAIAIFREWQQADLLPALMDSVLRAVSNVPGKGSVRVEESLSLDEFLRKCAVTIRGSVFLILDQFEEYFLYHPPSTSANRFDADLACAINRQDIGSNFLLSMREDGLSKLDRFRGRIPNLMANLLRLKHLNREAASIAMRGPLEEYNRHLTAGQPPVYIEDQLVDTLLDQVRTGIVSLKQTGEGQVNNRSNSESSEVSIETPFLQMVLTRLWEEERAEGSFLLRLNTLRRLGGAQNVVRSHLDKVMETFNDAERDVLARAFRFLVTPEGAKIAMTIPMLANWADVASEQLEPVLEKLCDAKTRILRPVPPPADQPAARRYEIYHDVLAASILEWRERFVQAQELAIAERRAAAEAAEKERESARQRELEQAGALAAEQKRRAEIEAHTARRLRREMVAIIMACVLAVIGFSFFWLEHDKFLATQQEKETALKLVKQVQEGVPLTYFGGAWKNTDAQTSGITTLDIRLSGATAFVHAWGACQPKDCDWGEVNSIVYAPNVSSKQYVKSLSAVYTTSFDQTLLFLHIDPATKTLEVEAGTHFTDNSQRADYASTYNFRPTSAPSQ